MDDEEDPDPELTALLHAKVVKIKEEIDWDKKEQQHLEQKKAQSYDSSDDSDSGPREAAVSASAFCTSECDDLQSGYESGNEEPASAFCTSERYDLQSRYESENEYPEEATVSASALRTSECYDLQSGYESENEYPEEATVSASAFRTSECYDPTSAYLQPQALPRNSKRPLELECDVTDGIVPQSKRLCTIVYTHRISIRRQ